MLTFSVSATTRYSTPLALRGSPPPMTLLATSGPRRHARPARSSSDPAGPGRARHRWDRRAPAAPSLRLAQTLPAQILSALDAQTFVVPGTTAVGRPCAAPAPAAHRRRPPAAAPSC